MGAKVIEVNTSTLKSDVSVIEGEIQSINSGANRLLQALHELESMWDGNAKQAFSAAVNDDILRLRELAKAMEKFTGKTSEARQEYDKCESAVSQIVSSIRV